MAGGFPDEMQVIDLISRGEWAQVKLVRIFINYLKFKFWSLFYNFNFYQNNKFI